MENEEPPGESTANGHDPPPDEAAALHPLLRSLRADLRREVREAVREEIGGRAPASNASGNARGDGHARLLTKEDVAERLRCSERTVDTLAAEGSLRKIKIKRLVRFSPEAVEAYIRRQANDNPAR